VARIPLIDPDDPSFHPALRQELLKWSFGPSGAPNVIRAMANHPLLLRGLAHPVYGPEARITPAQRELAYLTASVANRCHY
jgi:hypothetical protein